MARYTYVFCKIIIKNDPYNAVSMLDVDWLFKPYFENGDLVPTKLLHQNIV